jgi:hypothetical protein
MRVSGDPEAMSRCTRRCVYCASARFCTIIYCNNICNVHKPVTLRNAAIRRPYRPKKIFFRQLDLEQFARNLRGFAQNATLEQRREKPSAHSKTRANERAK